MAITDLWHVICYTLHNAYVRSKFSLKMHVMVNKDVGEVQRIFNYSKLHNNIFIYPHLFGNLFINFK